MITEDYPSLEVLAVEWVRDNVAVRALIGGAHPNTRVATRLPVDPFGADGSGTVGFLAVREITAGPKHVTAEILQGLMQFDCYGPRGAYGTAETLALTLIAQAGQLTGWTGTNGTISRLNFRSKQPVEEPETGWARYLVEISMIARV